MQSNRLDFIRRCSFIYPVVILTVASDRAPAEAGSTESQSGFITAHDGVPIAYSAYGAGSPTLLFVHGWSCDRSYWEQQVAPFSRDFRVVTVDLPGHGESGMGRKEWLMASFGADVSAVVMGLDLKNVILIGQSMGGAVILEAARRLPGRVRGLVFVDTYGDLSTSMTTEEITEFLIPFRANFEQTTRAWVRTMFPEDADQALVEQVVEDMSAAVPEVALEVLESSTIVMYGRDRTTLLQDLDVPLFGIHSDNPPPDAESMERYGVDVVTVSGVGHFLMMEDPARFNSALTNVIASIVD